MKKLLFVLLCMTSCLVGAQGAARYWRQFDHEAQTAVLGQWHMVSDEEIVHRFLSWEERIGGVFLYSPVVLEKDVRPLVFFVVHGTWARGDREFCGADDALFCQVLEFAQKLADRKRCPIEVVSYQWSGTEEHAARERAGKDLEDIMTLFYGPRSGYGACWGYGHSHGSNVLCIASRGAFFDTILSVGAPVTEQLYTPIRVAHFYHFYSSNDPWQYAGSFDRRSIRALFSWRGSGRVFEGEKQIEAGQMINVRLQFDGTEPGHIAIKLVVPYLWRIFDEITGNYHYHSHFDVDVSARRAGREVLVAIREPLTAEALAIWGAEGGISEEVIKKIIAERAYSEQQDRRFFFRHRGRHIGARSSIARQILANWSEYAQFLSGVFSEVITKKNQKPIDFESDE
jgi:hypothetical protein